MRSGGVTYGLAVQDRIRPDWCGKVRLGKAVRDTARCGEEWKHLIWQEVCRGLDGCIWYGKMGFGSLGQVRFNLARLGWAVRDRTGCVRSGRTRQSR